MTLHELLKMRFIYAKTYKTSLDNIKKIMYLDNDYGTVYHGAQAHNYKLKKRGASIQIYDWLSEEIYKYLTSKLVETETSFDKWHNSICIEFVNKCRSAGFNQLRTCARVEYGLAQKFLNIAMKYVYCFEDADRYDIYKKFDFCHIALDSYTYCPKSTSKTCKRYIGFFRIISLTSMTLRTPFYTEMVNTTINVRTLNPWSKLSYNDYIMVQNEIRSYLGLNPVTFLNVSHLFAGLSISFPSTSVLTPFQTEFLIW